MVPSLVKNKKFSSQCGAWGRGVKAKKQSSHTDDERDPRRIKDERILGSGGKRGNLENCFG